MSIIDCLENFDVDIMEYANLTILTPHTSQTFQLHIPKLMTFPMGDPIVVPVGFNNAIFINDPECRPSAGTTLPSQNFVTVHRHVDRDFKERKLPDDNLPKGQQFILTLMNRNIRDLKISIIM